MFEPLGAEPLKQTKKSRLGCWIVGIVLITTVPTFVIIAAVFGGVFLGGKAVEEYDCAVSEVRKNKVAIELLGEPIVDGTFVLPNISIKGSKRDVQFQVKLTGSKGTANLMVVSYRDPFRSDFQMMLSQDDKGTLLYSGVYPCR